MKSCTIKTEVFDSRVFLVTSRSSVRNKLDIRAIAYYSSRQYDVLIGRYRIIHIADAFTANPNALS